MRANLGKPVTLGNFVFPAILLCFAGIRWLPLSLLALVGMGWGLMTLLNSSISLVQTQVPDELHDRVIGIYTLVLSGALPIGALLAGTLESSIGEPLAVVVGASVLLFFALIVLIHVQEFKQAE